MYGSTFLILSVLLTINGHQSNALTTGETQLVEKFYLARAGDNLPWNRAQWHEQIEREFHEDKFLTTHAKIKLETMRKSPKRCSAEPKFETGLRDCSQQPHSTGDCFITPNIGKLYTCECYLGWQCESCNVTTFPCANVTQYCDNYADCLPSTSACHLPTCTCKPGYTTDWGKVAAGGLQCQADIDECLDSPCENGGICKNNIGSYKCACPEHWAGPNCQYIKRCEHAKYCGPGAYCEENELDGLIYGVCKCPVGLSGNPYTGCDLTDMAMADLSTDPHITTFDGMYYSYQGTLPVTVTRPNWKHSDRPFVPYFKVVAVSNHECSNWWWTGACIFDVYVDIRTSTTNNRIHFSASYVGLFDVDGAIQIPPYTELESVFTIHYDGNGALHLVTTFGVEVAVFQATHQGGSYLNMKIFISTSSIYRGNLVGLAGNMNGYINDDSNCGDCFVQENVYEGYGGDGGKLQSDLPSVSQSAIDWAKEHSKCKWLIEPQGPFGLCNQFLNQSVLHQAFENCAYDVGALRNLTDFDKDTCETHLKDIAHLCRNAAFKQNGVDNWKWRNATDCPPPPCPEHSTYKENSPMCLNNCTDPNQQFYCHTQELQETCVCDENEVAKYVLSVSQKGRCVLYPNGCHRGHKGITIPLQQESIDIQCRENCLFVSHDANVVCKSIQCQKNSHCSATKDGVRDCICDTGYIGDGRFECRIPQRNCADLQTYFHISESGIPSVGIWGPLGERTVYCDMVTNGGGWTILQRRVGNSLSFNRPWEDYVKGFGDLYSDYWYGLEALHTLTNSSLGGVLRIELTDCRNLTSFQEYENFQLGSSVENYRLFFGKSNGTAGDALLSLDPDTNSANGMEFSTFDRDNDFMPELNCATLYTGGWWFRRCTTSNLNGIFYPDCSGVDQSDSLQWVEDPQMTPQSFKLVEMKFRPTIYPPMD